MFFLSEKRPNVHYVFLPVELYIGIAKAQAELEIGKSSAILLMINEGLFRRGFISQNVYEALKRRYERKLVEIVRREEKSKSLTKADLEKQEELQQIEKILTEAYKQWNNLNPKAQAYHLKTAKEHSDLPIAQLILKEKGVSNE